jgi:arylsulfatase A-like enzyme
MPNVLLLTVDCLRADRLGYAGYPRSLSPNIDRLVEASCVFTQAYATGPRTAESFPAILTSAYSLSFGGRFRLPEGAVRLAQVLQRAGYATGAFHSNPFLSVDLGYAQGFDRFWDSLDKTPLTSKLGARAMGLLDYDSRLYKFLRRLVRGFEAHTGTAYYARAEKVSAMAAEWLESQPAPFFLWIHYMDMHYPFSPPSDHLHKLRPQGINAGQQADLMVRALEHPRSLDAQETQMVIDLYDAGLSYVDANVGRLLDTLEDLGFLENTLVILTGDHGEEFLEHGDFGHGALIHSLDGSRSRIKLYDELLHVPLVLRLPDLDTSGQFLSPLVSLIDLPPTVVDLVGLEPPAVWQGLSLGPVLRGEVTSLRPGVFSGYAVRDGESHWPVVSYRTPEWKYIHDGAFGHHEVYDLVADPGEQDNLFAADVPALSSLQLAVRDHLKAIDLEAAPGSEIQLDPEMVERMRALGYLD